MTTIRQSTLVNDARRCLPVFGIVAATALTVAFSFRYLGARHLREAVAEGENACEYAALYQAAAFKEMPELHTAAQEDRLKKGDLSQPSFGSLKGQPVAERGWENLARALELCPTDAETHRLAATYSWYVGDEAGTYYHMAEKYRLAGKTDDALWYYDMARTKAPAEPRILAGWIETLAQAGNLTEALKQADENRTLLLSTNDGRMTLGIVLSRAVRDDEAAPLLKEALMENPRNRAAILEWSFISRRGGKAKEGADFLMELGRDHDHVLVDGYHVAAELYDAAGDQPDREKALRKAIELFPNSAVLVWNLSTVRYGLGDYREARELVGRAMRLDEKFVLDQINRTNIDPRRQP